MRSGAVTWARTLGATALVVLGGSLLAPPAAPAVAVAVSATATELGGGEQQSISADGRYVTFTTRGRALAPGTDEPGTFRTGVVLRKDLASGALDLVAPPAVVREKDQSPVSQGTTGAASMSRNGRYVAFVTTQALSRGDLNGSTTDVYVRDMTKPVSSASAFELVSAVDGTDQTPIYRDANAGSGLAGLREISNDGRRVLFYVLGPSTIGSPTTTTPGGHLYLRDLDARTTRLVTRRADDRSAAGTPVSGPTQDRVSSAALSGDGTTVVWASEAADQQVETLPGETVVSESPLYLWRDVARTPTAPARRVTGPIDHDAPGCPPGTVVDEAHPTGPCFGPLSADETSREDPPIAAPVLSDDGLTVAFVTRSLLRAETPVAAQRPAPDVLVTDMTPGVSRTAATRELTFAPPGAGRRDNQLILALGMSGNGRFVTFMTQRTALAAASPRPVGVFPAPLIGTAALTTANAYLVDRVADTVERVTVGADGADYEQVVGPFSRTIAVSDDGSRTVIDATDGNLIVGDANGATDLFALGRIAPPAVGPPPVFTPPAPPPALAPDPLPLFEPLPVYATVGRVTVDKRGVARLVVDTPTAGRLTARATAPPLPVRRTRSTARPQLKKARPVAAPRVARPPLAVASATSLVRAPAGVRLTLAPATRVVAAARAAKRTTLKVTVVVRFVPTAPADAPPTEAVRAYVLPVPRPAPKRPARRTGRAS